MLFSCQEQEVDIIPYEPKIVVEGSIENGEYPSVLLFISGDIIGSKEDSVLLNNVIRNARVIVSDGTLSEILVLQTNSTKIPPYQYIGTKYRGEVGKTYTLTVEYVQKIITATTYILEPVPLQKISFRKINPKDTIGYIHIGFRNITNDYYQVSTQLIPEERVFTPCLYGNMDRQQFPKNDLVSLQINKGPVLYPLASYNTYFDESSEVFLKFSTQPKEAYDFWVSFQNEILNGRNPLFLSVTSLK